MCQARRRLVPQQAPQQRARCPPPACRPAGVPVRQQALHPAIHHRCVRAPGKHSGLPAPRPARHACCSPSHAQQAKRPPPALLAASAAGRQTRQQAPQLADLAVLAGSKPNQAALPRHSAAPCRRQPRSLSAAVPSLSWGSPASSSPCSSQVGSSWRHRCRQAAPCRVGASAPVPTATALLLLLRRHSDQCGAHAGGALAALPAGTQASACPGIRAWRLRGAHGRDSGRHMLPV